MTEIYYTLVSLISYFYDIWGLFYCNFILLEENEIFFVNQHTFNFMYVLRIFGHEFRLYNMD